MKILHVIPSVDMKRGGPSVAIRQMTEGLASKDVEITIATTTAGLDNANAYPTGRFAMQNHVRYIYFPVQTPRAWMFSLPLTRWLFQNARSYDVVHVHAAFPYPVWAACRASFRAGVPYIVRPAGTLDPYGMSLKSWKKSPYYKLMIRGCLQRAFAVQVTSIQEGDSLAALGFASKINTIPHAIALPEMRQNPGGIIGGPLQILFLSRLHPIKAVPVLLQAIRSFRRGNDAIRLTIVGAGAPEYTAHIKNEVERLGLGDIVHFSGYVQGKEKDALFRKADIFVLPSYHENFGIAVAEAMSYGLPAIVSDQVALSREILESQAGLVTPSDNASALAGAIVKLSDDKTRLKYGRNARRLVETRFSESEQIGKLIHLYETILDIRGAK